MLATVKFITTGATELLTWDCPVGRAYLWGNLNEFEKKGWEGET